MKCPNCDSDQEMVEFEDPAPGREGRDLRVCLNCGYEEER